jgi:hypothetical protein
VTNRNFMDVEGLEVYKKVIGYTFVEWIGENIGAESPRAITTLEVS